MLYARRKQHRSLCSQRVADLVLEAGLLLFQYAHDSTRSNIRSFSGR